jgi:type IV secretion system protein VirB9
MMLVVLLIGIAGLARAETVPARGVIDARIRTALYSPDEVYRLAGVVGYVIELIFEEGEVFAGKAGGDLQALAIDGFRNQVHIKPAAPVVATNLVIYTNRRAYRFDYAATPQPPEPYAREAIYAVRFHYPPDPQVIAAERAGARVFDALARAPAERHRNTDYWFCGEKGLKPLAAFDDGVHTRLTFSARAELPAIFVRNDDDTESLLNFHVEEGDVVIHRIARKLILRRGRLTGCIVNKAFSGAGERLESGTRSPAVRRERKAAGP